MTSGAKLFEALSVLSETLAFLPTSMTADNICTGPEMTLSMATPSSDTTKRSLSLSNPSSASTYAAKPAMAVNNSARTAV
eukprot:2907745-Amphidinium_carterae.1